jgi:hypothetical protein
MSTTIVLLFSLSSAAGLEERRALFGGGLGHMHIPGKGASSPPAPKPLQHKHVPGKGGGASPPAPANVHNHFPGKGGGVHNHFPGKGGGASPPEPFPPGPPQASAGGPCGTGYSPIKTKLKKVLVKNIKNRGGEECAMACDKSYSVGTPGGAFGGGEEKEVECTGYHFKAPKGKGKKGKCTLYQKGVSKKGKCPKKYTCCEKEKEEKEDPCDGLKGKKLKKCLKK